MDSNIVIAIISNIVTIGVVFITYFLNRNQYKKEIIKIKGNLVIEKTETIPYDICNIMEKMIKKQNFEEINKDYANVLYKVLAYGSKEAVKIAIKAQELSYAKDKSMKNICCFSLLITQLKYDLTNEIISPEAFWKLKVVDYEQIKEKIERNINQLVEELNLNKKFKVKEE